MISTWLVGGPSPIREAIADRLERRDIDVLERPPEPDVAARTIAVVSCRHEADWVRLEELADAGLLARIAVIDELDVDHYRRALASGAGVVHVDTSSSIIADVIVAAAQGEVVLPIEIARRIASTASGTAPTVDPTAIGLDPLETDILRAIADGATVVSLAARLHFSERTIRRRLQGIYVKLGVANRAEAIRAAERLGLSD